MPSTGLYQTQACPEPPEPEHLQPGEFAPAFGIPIDTADLEQIRLVAKPKETECKVDPDNEIVLTPPFCTAPG